MLVTGIVMLTTHPGTQNEADPGLSWFMMAWTKGVLGAAAVAAVALLDKIQTGNRQRHSSSRMAAGLSFSFCRRPHAPLASRSGRACRLCRSLVQLLDPHWDTSRLLPPSQQERSVNRGLFRGWVAQKPSYSCAPLQQCRQRHGDVPGGEAVAARRTEGPHSGAPFASGTSTSADCGRGAVVFHL